MLEILIVKYGLPDYEADCVNQVMKTVGVPYHLTVYDNFPLDEPLSVVWNKLIRRSNANFICLLNNDTIPHKGWVEKMLEVYKDKKDVGAVGCVSNTAGSIQGGFKKPLKEKKIQRVNMLSGFCMLFEKSVWERVNGFDERFKLYGEDSDFCRKIMRLELNLYVRFDAFVYHYGRKSTPNAVKRGKDIAKIKEESSRLYNENWNKDNKEL